VKRGDRFIEEGFPANGDPDLCFSNVKDLDRITKAPIGLFLSGDIDFSLLSKNYTTIVVYHSPKKKYNVTIVTFGEKIWIAFV